MAPIVRPRNGKTGRIQANAAGSDRQRAVCRPQGRKRSCAGVQLWGGRRTVPPPSCGCRPTRRLWAAARRRGLAIRGPPLCGLGEPLDQTPQLVVQALGAASSIVGVAVKVTTIVFSFRSVTARRMNAAAVSEDAPFACPRSRRVKRSRLHRSHRLRDIPHVSNYGQDER